MLCYDPDNRITAAQALVHPWFKEYPEPMRPQLTSDGKVIEPTPKPSTAPIKSDHQPAPSSKQSSAQRPHEPFTGGGGHLQGPVGPNYGPPTGYPAHRRWEDDYPPYNRGGYRSRSPEPYYRDYPPHQGYPPPRRRSPPRRYGDGPPYSHRSDHRYTPRVDER
jgi:serine/threonine protein kinase